MATLTGTVKAERWNDVVLIQASDPDGADTDSSNVIPNNFGIGDLAVMEIMVIALGITTMIADAVFAQIGMLVKVLSADGLTNIDIVGVEGFKKNSATAVAAYFSPDPLVLWRMGELLTFEGADLDTGTTADFLYLVKAVRVRPIESAARGPVRLVR